MNNGRYVFSQMVDFLPKRYFERLVKERNDKTMNWVLSYWSQLLVLSYRSKLMSAKKEILEKPADIFSCD